jgi:hypothetical protein
MNVIIPGPILSLAGLGEGLEKVLPVYVVQVDLASAIATTHHVVDRPSILNTRLTRHVPTRPEFRLLVKVESVSLTRVSSSKWQV